MSTVVDLYTLQLIADEGADLREPRTARVAEAIVEMEENLTDLLPAGYRARIRRWDQPDNEGNDDE